MVLGGGAEQASTEGRWIQWRAALPLIESNPITGHGFITAGFDIGSSIDSYVISVLVETGIPGFVFFAGIVCLPIWYGVRAYLTDLSESGALRGSLANHFRLAQHCRVPLRMRDDQLIAGRLQTEKRLGHARSYRTSVDGWRTSRSTHSRGRYPLSTASARDYLTCVANQCTL